MAWPGRYGQDTRPPGLSREDEDLRALLLESDESGFDSGLEEITELRPGHHAGELSVKILAGDGTGDGDNLDQIAQGLRHSGSADLVEDFRHLALKCIDHCAGELEDRLLDDEFVGLARG